MPDARYPYVVEEIAYRTVREAIVNVRKHAHATALEVVLQLRDGHLHGQVIDDGRGFEVAAALERSRRQRRMGLDTMRERLRLAGGTVEVTSSPGAGTVVSFALPVETSPDHRNGAFGAARRGQAPLLAGLSSPRRRACGRRRASPGRGR